MLSLSSRRHDFKLVCDYLHMRCQILGRKSDFDGVIDYAEMLLDLDNRFKQELLTNQTGYTIFASTALGYKGVALSMKKSWNAAYPCLLKSYQLYHESVHPERKSLIAKNDTTRLGRHLKEEAVAIERTLETCCTKIGREPPVPVLSCFPRTAHLLNTGGTAVSSDDLILSGDSSFCHEFGNGTTEAIVEEKIDGANLGFSLSVSGKILVQNRSHYISGGDHRQFGPLKQWICEHLSSLKKILTTTHHEQRAASQGLILFGEWCVARHSLPYNKLPGYFIAFDIYDRRERKFYSRRRFHGVLRHSGMPCAPVISVKKFGPFPEPIPEKHEKTKKERKDTSFESYLRLLLQTKSRFRTDGGTIEGVVIRIDDENAEWLEHRAKVVRPDFIRGITEHWARRAIEKQVVDPSFAETYCANEDCSLAPSQPLLQPLLKGSKTVPNEEGVMVKCTNRGSRIQGAVNPRSRIVVSKRTINEVVLPRNFSFLWEREVAISSTPKTAEQIRALSEHFRTSLVVTLTEEEPLPESWFKGVDCNNLFVPVPNYQAPTPEQMDRIVDRIEVAIRTGSSAVVHCGGGKGRAGTVAACLLLRFGSLGIRASSGSSEIQTMEDMPTSFSSSTATKHIRRIRPGSIETRAQESFIRYYANLLWKRLVLPEVDLLSRKSVTRRSSSSAVRNKTTVADSSLEQPHDNGPIANKSSAGNLFSRPSKAHPRCSRKSIVKVDDERVLVLPTVDLRRRKVPRCIVCMGLPGSGKSTFVGRLTASFPRKTDWLVINQDRLGRKECEKLAGNSRRKRVILDRCNPTASERARWLKLMHSPPKGELSLVYFSADASVCTSRVVDRDNHDTIPKGRGKRIVSEMADKLEPPTAAERRRFGSIHFVHSFDDAEDLLRSFGV